MTRPRLVSYALLLLVASLALPVDLHAAPPAAPSDLRLVAKGWNSFSYAWNDNANDETSQLLYLSEGGGPYFVITAYRPDTVKGALGHLNLGVSYRIYLTARNADGESPRSNVLQVYIPPPSLTAYFSYSPLRPAAGQEISFHDGSLGSPTRWAWDFGDGTTSTERNPKKTFSMPGEYRVSLKVSSSAGSATSTETVKVAAGSGGAEPLIAGFDCGSCDAAAGVEIEFSDTTTGGATAWDWSFGDGATSTERSPRHAWTAPGTYPVSLVVTGGTRSSAVVRNVTITPSHAVTALLVPVAGRVSGAAGSEWRTALTLTNFGTVAAETTLELLPATGARASRVLVLPAGAALDVDDALLDLFGLSEGSGAILVTATDPASLLELSVQSRTFTAASGGGSMGQFIPAVRLPLAGSEAFLTGIETGSEYRTNIGLVNSGEVAATATLQLLGSGAPATAVVTIPGGSFVQQSLSTLFPDVVSSPSALAVRIASDSGSITGYASVIDNATNDPTYVEALRTAEVSSLVIPVVGRTPGAEGTFWRTDVALANPSASTLLLTLRIAGTALSRDVTLAAAETLALRDVVAALGGDALVGTLEISSSGATPIVSARTYTTLPAGGTRGQSVPVVDGGRTIVRARLAGLRQDALSRSNVGFVDRSGAANALDVELLDGNAAPVASARITLAAGGQMQMRLTELFPTVDFAAHAQPLRIEVLSDDAPFLAYASVVDNASGDPLFILGE